MGLPRQYQGLFQLTLAQVNKVLDQGNFSDVAIARACEMISKFADLMNQTLSKVKAFAPYSHDDTPMALFAQTSGDAIGEHTHSSSSLKAGLIDYQNVTIAIGTASSVAVAEGGAEVAATSAFTGVVGSNFVFTKSYTATGDNWQKSTQTLFAVDFKFLDDDINLSLSQEADLLTDSRLGTSGGNVAKVDFDVTAIGGNSAVLTFADALAVADTISSTYVAADLLIG
jgi:hypothetical protein